MSTTGPVVVGVDGSDADRAAIRYGAAEARRQGSHLVLVHVIPTFIPITPTMPVLDVDLEVMGREVLSQAAAEARILVDGDNLTTILREGSRAAELLHQAEAARLLVLGSTPRSLAGRLVTGSILAGVASRAVVPVVAVPQGWSAAPEPRPVVVGVKSLEQLHGLLARAAQIQAERHSTLVLLHAWEVPAQYNDLFVTRGVGDYMAKDMREALNCSVAALKDELPEVPAEVQVVHGQPARVLQLISEDADLVLLTRRPHAFPRGHLGGTGRAVLREAHCPVEVLPPVDNTADASGPAQEMGGEMLK